jgi:hypothetical protein
VLFTSGQPNVRTPPTAPISAMTTAMGMPASIIVSITRKASKMIVIVMI